MIIGCVCFVCFFQSAIAQQADYLSPELRQHVEQLKQSFQNAPTNPNNYSGRAKVLWDWANAFALSGGSLPVNLTTAVRPVLPDPPTRRNGQGIDFYIKELTLLDEEPNALGTLTADLGPFEARTFVTVVQRYTVGSKPIVRGGGILVARHFMPGYGQYQDEDPAGDNYMTITSSNASVEFRADGIPVSGMHGGFRGAAPARIYRIEKGTLNSGDVVTITYGDKSGGSRGWLMGSASTDFLPVPLYVDFDGSDHTYALPIQPIRVSGTELAGVHVFSPSVVRPGETFDISVRAQDRFYNRAKGAIPGFKVYANGKPWVTTQKSSQAITVIKGLTFEEEGSYQISVVSDDGSISGNGNPVLVSRTARKVYWGDTHGHSGFAEGIGTPDHFMEWAKEDARLDFVTHSEHDIWMDDSEWEELVSNVTDYSEPGRFTAYLGYEWTTQNQWGGHHNVLFRDLENNFRLPNQIYPTLSSLFQGLRTNFLMEDVLVIPHAHQAGDYRQSDPELVTLVEIMSKHGTFEWFGRMYLNHGHEVGFIAASDDHLSQPGYTAPSESYHSQRGGLAAVLAEENTRDGIFDAMKSLQAYATSGDKIILDVSINGVGMGKRIPFSEDRTIKGRVIGTAPIGSITVIKNDEEIWHKDYLTIESGDYADEEDFYITFSSESFPMHAQDNPRGTRGWGGRLEISGAEILAFEGTDFLHPEVSSLSRDPRNANALLFETGTRGDTSSIKVRLKNVSEDTRIHFDFNATTETGSPPRFRQPARIRPAKVDLAFKDLQRGQTVKAIPLDVYRDRVTLRRVINKGETDVSFELKDQSNLQGEYYYVRVVQANDAMAWSSPIWVGGYEPR
ncbi:MAG: DUF3604 domain-containing protein [Verrucomicrobia bacterium]|nr:DUF3604 domain-containing protein [Verrucomicrobiota bacterium]